MKLGKHPLHSALVHFPLGLLGAVPACDLLAVLVSSPLWWAAAQACLLIGLAAAVVAAVTGFVDYVGLADDEVPLATRHLGWVLGAVALFGTSAVLRAGMAPPEGIERILAPVASALGMVPLAVGGWYGAELVYGRGVGVRRSDGEPPS